MYLNNASLYRFLTKTFVMARAEDVKDAISVSTMAMLERNTPDNPILNVEAFRTTVAIRALHREYGRKRKFDYPDSHEYLCWDDYHATSEALIVNETASATIDANDIVEQAPNQYAEVMRLCYLEGLTLKEAAEQVGISHVAMRKRHERAIKWARKKFGE